MPLHETKKSGEKGATCAGLSGLSAAGHRSRALSILGWSGFVAASLVFSAVGAEARTVGLLLAKSDTFMNTLRDGIEAHAAKLGNVELKVEDPNGEADRQIEMLKGLVGSGVAAVITIPVDGDQGVAMSKIATDAGVPLVFLNNQPIHVDELPERQTYVGSDEKESGTLQTAEVCRLLGGKGRVAVMMGELLHFAARTRTTDIDHVLAGPDCAGIEIVERQSANWSRGQAQALVGEWLGAGVSFDAVIANNDEMALGAIEGLKMGAGWSDRMIVAGIDATKAGLAAVKSGDMQVTILQNATSQGLAALDAALALADGRSVPSKIFVPFELVTPANVDTYIAAR